MISMKGLFAFVFMVHHDLWHDGMVTNTVRVEAKLSTLNRW